MEADAKEQEQIVLTRIMRLNAMLYGLVFGVFAGLALFLATNWLVIKGGPVVGPHLSLLAQYFPGYRVTFLGSLIGFVYASVLGFLVAYFIARVYNRILDLRASNPSNSHDDA
jgi:hypothetical protein